LARTLSSTQAEVVVYRGPRTTFTDSSVKKGHEYRYVIASVDATGTRSAGVALVVRPRAMRLVRPADGSAARPPLRFRWAPAKRATYYNLQLYREQGGGSTKAVKILSAWPRLARFTLAKRWSFEGQPERLRPGRYRWYVWPGFGRRSAKRYGELLGQSAFVVRAGSR
jgi:hypothetical protein